MPRREQKPYPVSRAAARRIWLHAQRLDEPTPFGAGPDATREAVKHLGYVQIDTINVIERCHHHILYTRIPDYRRIDLAHAQSVEKSVFEYWTHALAYVPTENFRFYVRAMRSQRENPNRWFGSVTKQELRRALSRIRREGPLTIRDIDDDELVDKLHLWASRKPSKRVLELAFHMGHVAIAARTGMLKTYEVTLRHFGWDRFPRAATPREVSEYQLDRALRSQGIVSLDSAGFRNTSSKPGVRELIEKRVRRKEFIPVAIEGSEKVAHWARPEALETTQPSDELVHILSPFDPLIIQRKRLAIFFGYDHIFEAYLKKENRRFGYFALPVLFGDEIVAAIDLKTDRTNQKLLVRQWTWVGNGDARLHKPRIEEALHRFERFQLGN